MSSIDLRYLASREWMASEIQAGRAIPHRRQVLSVDLGRLKPQLVKRVEAVADAFLLLTVKKKSRVCVLDSGIDPELSFGPTKKQLTPLDKPIIDSLGVFPELPAPSDDPLAVVKAWEVWLREYTEKALKVVGDMSANPPSVGRDEGRFGGSVTWDSVGVSFGEGLATQISLDQGAEAIRDVRAGKLWLWAANVRFSSESVAAAREATDLPPSVANELLEEGSARDLAAVYIEQSKKRFLAAKAHDLARRAKVDDFEVEMKQWAEKHGSDRLRLGIEDGYRMNSRYLTERIAAEAPGMYAMPASASREDWASKASSPSGEALRLRRRIAAAMSRNAPPNLDGQPQAEIVSVKKPPHEIYYTDSGVETEDGIVGEGLPSRAGWPWHVTFENEVKGLGPKPFEAVVVKHWLGRFHLIGAVADEHGNGPPGIWALPDIDRYGDDGVVTAVDPDELPPNAARRKPPEPEREDDIPF